MRRHLLLAVVACVSCQGANDAPPKTGPWFGTTTQGYPIQYTVQSKGKELFITRWQLRLDLRCESERVIRAGIIWSARIPIENGRFSFLFADLRIWHRWTGESTASGKMNGRIDSVWPALAGRTLEELKAEKCSAPDLGWAAKPGRGGNDLQPADVVLTVDADGGVTVAAAQAAAEHLPPRAGEALRP